MEISEDSEGSIYSRKGNSFLIRDIVKGAEIVSKHPKQIYYLKVIFKENDEKKERDQLTTSMLSCSNLASLHLVGFGLPDFHDGEYTQSGSRLSQIVPKLTSLILEESNMPLTELSSLKNLLTLQIIRPPIFFLRGEPIKLEKLTSLTVQFETIPQSPEWRFPIDLTSVINFHISSTPQSNMGANELALFSKPLESVNELKLHMHKAHSLEELGRIVQNVPNLLDMDIDTIPTTKTKEFRQFFCKNCVWIDWKIRGHGTTENLETFFNNVNTDLECGQFSYVKGKRYYTFTREKKPQVKGKNTTSNQHKKSKKKGKH